MYTASFLPILYLFMYTYTLAYELVLLLLSLLLYVYRDGFASRFLCSDLTSTGRTSRGVRALNLRAGDSMADMDILKAGMCIILCILCTVWCVYV